MNAEQRLRVIRWGVFVRLFVCAIALSCVLPQTPASAAALDCRPYASFYVESRYGLVAGAGIFDRNTGRAVTRNDFETDLGMDDASVTWRIGFSARPLEHHALRVYGTIPHQLKGGGYLDRELVTGLNTYPIGTEVETGLETQSLGFGYDLDLLIGPLWYGGFNTEMLYLSAEMDMTSISGSLLEDSIAVSETLPCFGAHVEHSNPLSFGGPFDRLRLGGFVRIAYSLFPDFVNYVDLNAGLSVRMVLGSGLELMAKAGVERESFSYDKSDVNGNLLQFTRDGVFLSISGSF